MMQRTDFWTERECTIAAKLYRVKDRHRGSQHRIFKRIAVELGRTVSGVNARFQEHGANFIGNERTNRYRSPYAGHPHYVTPELHVNVTECTLAARDALSAARETRDLTATICGDPPPGYRALDGAQGLCHSRPSVPYLSAVSRS